MAIDFQRVSVSFEPPITGREYSRRGAAVFGGTVRKAEVVVAQFDMFFRPGEHPIHEQAIGTRITAINGPRVDVDVSILLRDASGNIDDPYGGAVDVLVIADVV